MSALINIDNIPLELRKKMIEDLIVTANGKDGKKTKYKKNITYNTYDVIDDDLWLFHFLIFSEN